MMFGGIGMVFFWGVIMLVVALFAWSFTGGSRTALSGSSHSGSTALDILQERYAKGEISQAEYEQRKKTLTE